MPANPEAPADLADKIEMRLDRRAQARNPLPALAALLRALRDQERAPRNAQAEAEPPADTRNRSE